MVSVLKTRLDSKWAVFICILLAVINKILLSWLFTDLEGDKALYLLFSKSLLEGHSLLEPIKIAGSDSSFYRYNPAITSPVYSLFAAPFLWLTRSYFTTSVIIDGLSWLVFFGGIYKIVQLLFQQRWIINTFIICTGFFLYPHEINSGPKDTLAIGLILWSVYLTFRFIKNEKPSTLSTILIPVVYCLFALTKYLYSPLVIVFILLLFLHAWNRKNRNFFLKVFAIASCCFFIAYLFNLYLLHLGKEELYTDNSFAKGFFIENFLQIYPFISAALINTNFWCVQLESIFNIPFSVFFNVFQLLDLLLFILIIALLIYYYKKIKLPYLFFIFLSISMAIMFMVFYMSVTNKALPNKALPGEWTFVSESRSFLFIIIFLQLLFFYLIFKTNLAARGLKNFLFILFVIECMHGVYYTIKQVNNARQVLQANLSRNQVQKIVRAVNAKNEKYGAFPLLTTEDNIRRYALLNGIDAYRLPLKDCDSSLMLSQSY
ncbi:MAG: hypothetical protein M3352_09030, partial [Bacteroidota bacterium]|nr:hypothetical protein [Bacteroidota bacterium]